MISQVALIYVFPMTNDVDLASLTVWLTTSLSSLSVSLFLSWIHVHLHYF